MSEQKLNVTVIFHPPHPIPARCIPQTQAVSPKINVVDASAIDEAAKKGDTAAQKKLDALLAKTDVFFGMFDPKTLVAKAPNLKWVQNPFSGVDMWGFSAFVNSSTRLTNASGIHGTQVGEIAIWHMISQAKDTPRICKAMRERRHESFEPVILYEKTACILALGPIGKHVAHVCKGFGMRVIAVEADPKVKCRDCEKIYLSNQLHQALAESDFVIDCLPLLDATAKIMGAKEFKAMKKTAFFINIGRGGTVDQDALIVALKNGTIAGAGLDAHSPEQLPPDSPLWDAPHVTLTGHIGGQHPEYARLANDLFCKNMAKFLAGRKMLTEIDKKTLKVTA